MREVVNEKWCETKPTIFTEFIDPFRSVVLKRCS